MIRGAVILALALIAAPIAFAQTDDQIARADAAILASCIERASEDPDLDTCMNTISVPCMSDVEGQTTAGMIFCHMREAQAWDGQLNAVYRRLRGGASANDEGGRLQQAQRAWIAFRDANCDFEASLYEGGSLAGVLFASCMSDMTARRAIDLIVFERNSEG